MRLIDANRFLEYMEEKCDPTKQLDLIILAIVSEALEEQPTAYDVDKVVAELERHCKENCNGFCGECDFRDSIEIVKQGGIADDVCEWKLDDDDYWHTGCRNKIDNMDNEVNTIEDYIEHTRFNYCPFCRKKIKVVGNDNEF